jgi:hypothetical protein
MFALLFACSGEDNQTSREVSSGSNAFDSDEPKPSSSSEPSEDSTDAENETISIPEEVSGAFLVCTPAGSSEDTDLNGVYGCGLRDPSEKKKVESEEVRDNLQVSYEDDAGETIPIGDLNRKTDGTPWHVMFALTDEQINVATKVVGDLEIGDTTLQFNDPEFDQDDPDIADELEAFRLDPSAYLEQIKELVGLLLK